jgi:hypothetical protein
MNLDTWHRTTSPATAGLWLLVVGTVSGNDPIEMKYSQSVKESHAVRAVFHLDFIACPHLSFGTRSSRSPELSPNSRRESNYNED